MGFEDKEMCRLRAATGGALGDEDPPWKLQQMLSWNR